MTPPMTSPLIERVARALARSDVPEFSWDDLARGQAQYRKLARAAIDAMREPSEGMCKAGAQAAGVRTCWLLMIDEALK